MPTRIEVNCATGVAIEVELTAEELAAIAAMPPPAPPSPLAQIRALEAQYADKQAKITRQTLLLTVLTAAMESPAGVALSAGKTPEQAKAAVTAVLLASDPSFKLMYELEQQVENLRAQMP